MGLTLKYQDNTDFPYMVSVRLLTYNHASYIRQALDGILNQKCSFKIEVVVGDDFSTDATRQILTEYKSTENIYLNILDRPMGGEYWLNRQEKGRLYNFKNTLENCSGKYIALLDGDDFWNDSSKLQKQVDFLEANREYVLCYHDTNKIDGLGNIVSTSRLKNHKQELSQKDLVCMSFIPTLTVVFRNLVDKLPANFCDTKNGDTFLFSFLGQYGKGKWLTDIDNAMYRVHEGGIWSMKSVEQRISAIMDTTNALMKNAPNEYKSDLFRVKEKQYIDALRELFVVKAFDGYKRMFKKLFFEKEISKTRVLFVHFRQLVYFFRTSGLGYFKTSK